MENSPWLLTVTSVVLPAIVGIWTFVQWFASRKDRQKEKVETDEQRRETEFEKDRHDLIESQAILMAQLRTDIERYRKIIEEKNQERFYAWDRARFWHQKAWDMRNEAAFARQIVESANRLGGLAPRVWEVPLDMPQFDAPEVKAPPRQTA